MTMVWQRTGTIRSGRNYLESETCFPRSWQKNNEQLALLDRIDLSKKQTRVEIGALVITENQKFIISISLGKIELEGEMYFAISPAVPIYKAIDGKKEGEEFEFNGRKNTILEVC
jgi:hypothetical protein